MCNSLQLKCSTTRSQSNNLNCSNVQVASRFSIGKILVKTTSPLKQEPAYYNCRPHPLSLDKSVPRNDTESTTEKPQPPQQQYGIPTIEDLRRDHNLASSKLPFLWKLHILLDDVEATGNDHIVSWLEHGRSFKVYRPKSFITMIAPQYFKQSKYKSFQRQLHLYDFGRVQYGIEAGSYSHPLFVRGQPQLCLSLSPIKIKCKARQQQYHRQALAAAVIAQQQEQQQRQMETSQSIHLSSLPGKRPHLASNGKSFCVPTTATAILSKREQEEWVAKIQRMLVTGSTLLAELEQKQQQQQQQQQQKEAEQRRQVEQQEQKNHCALSDSNHPTSTSSNHHGINGTNHVVTDDDDSNDDDTCSLFGVNFHLLPQHEDVSSCENYCESDTEDDVECGLFLLDSE
jgi:HSF-type DNA-binding